MITTVVNTLEAFLIPFSTHLRSKGWQVDALAAGVENSDVCKTHFDHTFEIPWTRRIWDFRNFWRACAKARQIISNGDYDIVHVHTPIAAFIIRVVVWRLNVRKRPALVYTAHGFHFHATGHPLLNLVFATAERVAGRWTDRLVVINRDDYKAAIDRRIIPEERLCLMPGIGLDLCTYNPNSIPDDAVAKVRDELGLPENVPLILMVAEFNPGKRHLDLLTAFAALQNSNAHLAFAGRGRLLAELQGRVVALGLESRVHFLGFRTDVPLIMRASVVTVLPSEREGLPRSVMESMALGIPVIGANVRGIRDLLAGGGGILYPVGDVAALRGALEIMLNDAALRNRLVVEARQRIEAYRLPVLLELHDRLYASLLRDSDFKMETCQ